MADKDHRLSEPDAMAMERCYDAMFKNAMAMLRCYDAMLRCYDAMLKRAMAMELPLKASGGL